MSYKLLKHKKKINSKKGKEEREEEILRSSLK